MCYNNAYGLCGLNGCQQGFRSVDNFGVGGQESSPQSLTAYRQTVIHSNNTQKYSGIQAHKNQNNSY